MNDLATLLNQKLLEGLNYLSQFNSYILISTCAADPLTTKGSVELRFTQTM